MGVFAFVSLGLIWICLFGLICFELAWWLVGLTLGVLGCFCACLACW